MDIDLLAKAKQSDGSMLNPFEQAKRYADALKNSERPRFIVTCNFKEFYVYDLDDDNPQENKYHILLNDLPKEYSRLSFLTSLNEVHLKQQLDVSIEAGNLVGKLYDTLLNKYAPTDDEEQIKKNLHSLNVLCVRLVFCLYAEDSCLFNKDSFAEYIKSFKPEHARQALIDFFKWIDTKVEDRDPYADEKLKAFPYVNGGLFHDNDGEKIIIPPFDEDVVNFIVNDLSLNFNWSAISPTIFGAVFESTLNPETRRAGGMHYTSLENIHKVIDPLFLDDLKEELAKIKEIKLEKKLQIACDEFQQKLSKLVFLDPAAGSGNFLTETYLSLRKLENEVFLLKSKGMGSLGAVFSPILVNLNQFYGIEINDFAVSVAKTAIWIAEAQMQAETEKILNQQLNFFPLKNVTNYVEGNALRMNWEDVVPIDRLNYIIGNPPFVGAKLTTEAQREDKDLVFGSDISGKLDYVCCWYKKATQIMQENENVKSAFVSTNSITQGEIASLLWKILFDLNVHIDFSYKTFIWDSEASLKAHVHVVIVGFSLTNSTNKYIYSQDKKNKVNNINQYLLDAPSIIIDKRMKPLCPVKTMTKGSQLIDDGNFMFSLEEKDEFINKYPEAEDYIYEYVNADSFLNARAPKYCLCLKNCPQNIKNSCKGIKDIIQRVYDYRINSSAKSTKKLASTPSEFFITNIPSGNSLIFPVVSSERRKYIPLGFIKETVIYTNATNYIDNVDMYDFGLLISSVHMAWMRTVCGRLEMRYRYSKDIVYNNFPWPTPSEDQKAKIEKTAQGILDARALYPDSSLADLYDELTMPIELRKAHQANDKAVMEAYGFDKNLSEDKIVAKLFEMYVELTSK